HLEHNQSLGGVGRRNRSVADQRGGATQGDPLHREKGNSMTPRRQWAALAFIPICCSIFAAPTGSASAQTLQTLYSFGTGASDGANPFGALVPSSTGGFFGTTRSGGAYLD